MKTLTVVLNIVMLGFTGLVLATDGVSSEALYIVFTLLHMAIPLFTLFVLARIGAGLGWKSGVLSSRSITLARAAAVGNIVLLGCFCWAFLDQYPHPKEDGFVAYVVLSLLTPIVSAVTLFLASRRGERTGAQMNSAA